MRRTMIPYVDMTWNPIVGCRRISPGCEHCYAERLASTRLKHLPAYQGLTRGGRWTGESRITHALRDPKLGRKSKRIFVCDMGDLFADAVIDASIDAVFQVMACNPQHTFFVLTKRAERMLEWLLAQRWFTWGTWPILNNVWLGVTVEDQQRADDRLRLLASTPAAHRWVSAEPLLGNIDLLRYRLWRPGSDREQDPLWVVAGGESGPKARPCDVEWLRSIRDQCKPLRTPVFIKQLGSRIRWGAYGGDGGSAYQSRCAGGVHSRSGADPGEWPEDIRVREIPGVTS